MQATSRYLDARGSTGHCRADGYRDRIATQRRDEFRQISAMTVVTIIVMTAYALSAPVYDRRTHAIDPPSAAGFDWMLPLLIVASVIGTWFAWVVLVERRWPWPIGKRSERDRRSDTAWTAVPAIAAWVVAQFIRSSWTPASGVYFRGRERAVPRCLHSGRSGPRSRALHPLLVDRARSQSPDRIRRPTPPARRACLARGDSTGGLNGRSCNIRRRAWP